MVRVKETKERAKIEKGNLKSRVTTLQKLKMDATKVNIVQDFIES